MSPPSPLSESRGFSELGTGLKLALLTLPGVLAGALAAVRVGDKLFEEILAVVLVFVCASFFLKPDSLGKLLGGGEGQRKWILYPAMVAIGFYGGFVQVGAGFLIMAVLYHVMGAGLVRVNFHKVIVILFYTVPAVLIFFLSGNVNLFVGMCSCRRDLRRRMAGRGVFRERRGEVHKARAGSGRGGHGGYGIRDPDGNGELRVTPPEFSPAAFPGWFCFAGILIVAFRRRGAVAKKLFPTPLRGGIRPTCTNTKPFRWYCFS